MTETGGRTNTHSMAQRAIAPGSRSSNSGSPHGDRDRTNRPDASSEPAGSDGDIRPMGLTGLAGLLAILCLGVSGWVAGAAEAASPDFGTEVVDPGDGDVGRYTSLVRDEGGDLHVVYYDDDLEALRYAYQSDGEWYYEVVDAAVTSGWFGSLALASDGQARVVYLDLAQFLTRYAVRTGAGWAIQTLPTPNNTSSAALELDSLDRPHVSLFSPSSGDLYYATLNGSTWQVDVVDVTGTTGSSNSIAIDSADRPHIAYQDGGGHLSHAYKSFGSWIRETVDPGVQTGAYCSIAIDPTDVVHIAHFQGSSFDDLRYAKRNSTGWSTETIASAGDVGRFVSLALDGSTPEVAYYDMTEGTLQFARKPSGTWLTETVDPVPDTGVWPSIVPGPDRAIAYYSMTRTSLGLATWNGSGWDLGTLDSGGVTGPHSSLALFGNAPRIAYQDGLRADLRFASWDGSVWNLETVDPDGSTGFDISMAVDPGSDIPHIVYFSDSADDILYAVGGTSWTIETIDPVRADGECDLALSSAGAPRVSYRSAVDTALWYAERDGTGWTRTPVDANGDAGLDTALGLDSLGEPHILYRADGDFRYARRNSSVWSIETVPAPAGSGYGTDLVIDLQDELHAAFVQRSTGVLYYGHRTAGPSGVWSFEVVATGLIEIWELSCGLDPLGQPAIAYYQPNSLRAEYAGRVGGSWEIGPIDDSGRSGRFPSLAFGSDGAPRASYHDPDAGTLRFASAETGTSAVAEDSPPAGRTNLVLLQNPVGPEGPRVRWSGKAASERNESLCEFRLDIFDPAGRRIGSAPFRSLGGDVFEAQWSGDRAGGQLRAGVYFGRVWNGPDPGQRQTVRFVVGR